MKIWLAYVHPGFVRHEFLDSVLRTVRRYDVAVRAKESGTNIQTARNDCVRWFLTSEADYMLFVDTDMFWDAEVPQRLIDYDVPIVSASYVGRNADGTTFPVGKQWGRAGAEQWLYNVEEVQGLTPVAAVGMGCCMIRREVLEKLEASTEGNPDNWPFATGEISTEFAGPIAISEDINFCLRAGTVGFDSYIAADVPVGHVKTVTLTPKPALQLEGIV